MNKIAIITTGGTIAMRENSNTKEIHPTEQSALNNVIPLIQQENEIEIDNFINYPSPHITPIIMYELTLKINNYLKRPDIKGVVITHGTDTLEETAYFIDLLTSGKKPVVITGAMRSLNEIGADGPLNMLNAVRVASNNSSTNKGVLVVFNDEIHLARYVTKTHTSNVATFQSTHTGGPIGIITKNEIHYTPSSIVNKTYPLKKPEAKVGLIKAATGMDDLLINTYINHNYKGIVIEALGQGNLPPTMLEGIQTALIKGIKVVLVSRCFNGFVDSIYGYEGGGKQLKDLGVSFYHGINGQKARIQLMVELSK